MCKNVRTGNHAFTILHTTYEFCLTESYIPCVFISTSKSQTMILHLIKTNILQYILQYIPQHRDSKNLAFSQMLYHMYNLNCTCIPK